MSSDLPLLVVAAAAITAAAIDVRTRRVPNVLTGAIALVGVGIAAAAVGAFTATANAGGTFNRPTWLLVSGIVAAVGAVAFVAIRWARRD